MAETARVGRPPLPEGERKDIRVRFYLTPDLYRRAREAARRRGRALSAWLREVIAGAVDDG